MMPQMIPAMAIPLPFFDLSRMQPNITATIAHAIGTPGTQQDIQRDIIPNTIEAIAAPDVGSFTGYMLPYP